MGNAHKTSRQIVPKQDAIEAEEDVHGEAAGLCTSCWSSHAAHKICTNFLLDCSAQRIVQPPVNAAGKEKTETFLTHIHER